MITGKEFADALPNSKVKNRVVAGFELFQKLNEIFKNCGSNFLQIYEDGKLCLLLAILHKIYDSVDNKEFIFNEKELIELIEDIDSVTFNNKIEYNENEFSDAEAIGLTKVCKMYINKINKIKIDNND